MRKYTYKKDDKKEYDSPELLMKRGRWSLWKEDDESSLWHQCSKGKEEVDKWDECGTEMKIVLYPVRYVRFNHRTSKEVKPAWKCGTCMKKPPKSILSVYVLHNFDNISDEMGHRDIMGTDGWLPPGGSTI